MYPLSGQYGLLPRLLYYGLLIFSVVAHRQVWLIAGAMASALTYSGTTAIHAVILASTARDWILDLDAFGVWAIVSTGCLAVIPVLDWSRVLVESQFRPVFGFWGFLVALGSICASVPLYRYHVQEPACRSSGHVLIGSSQHERSTFNCTYACFSTRQILRDPSEITVIPSDQINWILVRASLGLVLTGSCFLAIFGCCLTTRKRTEAELRACIKQNKGRRADTMIRGGWGMKKARRLAERELETGQVQMPQSIWGYVNPVLFPIVVTLNEYFLLGRGGLPSNEELYAIGQWAPLVGLALALIAAGIVRYKEPQWRERQAILVEERAAFELRKREEAEAGLRNKRQCSANHADQELKEVQSSCSNPTDADSSSGCSSSKVAPCSSQGSVGSDTTASKIPTKVRPRYQRRFLDIVSGMIAWVTALGRTRTKSDVEATGARIQ